MLQEHLVKLHFDDLMDSVAIAHVWVRYLSGTVAGLQEAALRGDVAAARHLVGLSLHAIQDFYAHSNWVDEPARRTSTYLERTQERGWGRTDDKLYTGTYERPSTQGDKPHGHYQFLTPVLQQEPLKTVLTAYCDPKSPWSGSAVCAAFRETADSTSVQPGVLDFTLPDGAIAVSKGGIALDNLWIADNSAANRATPDSATGTVLFAAAKELALLDSTRWLGELEQVMA
nr:hypothetical protein [Micromonospora sp. DSM 115978]